MKTLMLLAMLFPAIAFADDGSSAHGWPAVPDLNGLLADTYATGKTTHGILTGPAYEKLPPIKVTVSVAAELPQPGCKQMRIVFDQQGYLPPGSSTPEHRHAGFFMPYCKGGALPSPMTAPLAKETK